MHVTLDLTSPRTSHRRRKGMAALEVVMTIGAIAPVALVIWIAIAGYDGKGGIVRFVHSHIGNVVGSPLF